MDIIFCAVVMGTLYLLWRKHAPPKKLVQIQLTSIVHKSTQTDLQSPMSVSSSVSSLQFIMDETYLETRHASDEKCGNPTGGSIESSETPDTMIGAKRDTLTLESLL